MKREENDMEDREHGIIQYAAIDQIIVMNERGVRTNTTKNKGIME